MAATNEFQIIRGGRLLDAAARTAAPADILVEGARIREIGAPGLAAPEAARVVDAAGRLLMPGLVNAHTHGHGGLAKGIGDRWSLELLLNAGPWISGNRSLDDKYLSAPVERRRDAAQGLHGRLRSLSRGPAADRRGHGAGRPRLCRCRYPRGDRADDGRPAVLRGDSGTARCTARRPARPGRGGQRCALRREHRGGASGPARLAARPLAGQAGAGRRPFRCTAQTNSSSPAATWPTSTASACTCISANRAPRRSRACAAMARR